MRVTWENGYMALYQLDERLSYDYEVPEKDYMKMAKMVNEIAKKAYEKGKEDKQDEILRVLGINV